MMDEHKTCPKCKRLQPCIRYGSFKLKNGQFAQRIRCKTCGKTSVYYRHPFFNGMRFNPGMIHRAMLLYYKGNHAIKEIALKLKTRPNTIIDWIRKVRSHEKLYTVYLKKYRNYDFGDVRYFFYHLNFDLTEKAKMKRTKQLKQYRLKPPLELPSSSELS